MRVGLRVRTEGGGDRLRLGAPGGQQHDLARQRRSPGSVIDTRGTNGSSPASGTPTTSRDALGQRRLVGEQRERVAVGADPEQQQIELGRAGVAQLALVRRRPPASEPSSPCDPLDSAELLRAERVEQRLA